MISETDRRATFESVFDAVYEPLQRYFGRRASAADVPELVNDALMVIWRRLDDVPLDDPLAWSYGVGRRCLANSRRANQRRLRLVGRLTSQPVAEYRCDDHADATIEHDALRSALATLDDAERELIRLWAWEQLEPREIAIVLESNANAVSLRLTRAKKKLAASMERQNRRPAGQEVAGHGKEHRS